MNEIEWIYLGQEGATSKTWNANHLSDLAEVDPLDGSLCACCIVTRCDKHWWFLGSKNEDIQVLWQTIQQIGTKIRPTPQSSNSKCMKPQYPKRSHVRTRKLFSDQTLWSKQLPKVNDCNSVGRVTPCNRWLKPWLAGDSRIPQEKHQILQKYQKRISSSSDNHSSKVLASLQSHSLPLSTCLRMYQLYTNGVKAQFGWDMSDMMPEIHWDWTTRQRGWSCSISLQTSLTMLRVPNVRVCKPFGKLLRDDECNGVDMQFSPLIFGSQVS